MKKFTLITLLFILAAMLIVSGCGSDSDKVSKPEEITPAKADWMITIFYGEEDIFSKTGSYYGISAWWFGNPNDIVLGATAQIKFDNQTIELGTIEDMFGLYWNYAELNPGQTYDVKFIFNGTERASTTLRIPYTCSANFSSTYNPSSTANISWTLANDNQYQYAGIDSWGPGEDDFDEDMKFIKPSARSHSIKANAVDSYGAYTEYTQYVGQMSYKLQNRIAFLAVQEEMKEYGSNKGNDMVSMVQRSKNLLGKLGVSF